MTTSRTFVLGPGRRGPPSLVGGKAAGLQRLAALGLPVPPWITVTTRAADAVLRPQRETLMKAMRGEVDDGMVARVVRTAPWPPRVRRALAHALARLEPRGRLAVRSSVVGEDGADASYAGQFVTVLDVKFEEVADAVRRCWAGAFGAHLAHYRRHHGVDGAWPRIAVVVQEMVDSDVAGIAFTADPRTGAPAHMVVAGHGLGCGVVDDRVEADSFVRQRGRREWRQHIVHKTSAVRRLPDAPHPVTVPVPAGLRDRPALDPHTLEQLASLLDRLDGGGPPVDVEWALDRDGHLALLQARPLTALPPGALEIWDDSNIGENFPGLTLPLTASYVRHLYARLFRGALAEVGIRTKDTATLHRALHSLLGLIRGRLYLNLTNYYRLFASVPGLGWTVRLWERALGIEGGDALRSALPELRRAPAPLTSARVVQRLIVRFRELDREVARFRARSEEFLDRWDSVSFEGRSSDDLLGMVHTMHDEFVGLWTVHIFNDLFLFVLNSVLERLIGDTELHRRVMGGMLEPASLAPLVSLFALADVARVEPEVDAVMRGPLPAETAWARINRFASASRFLRRAAQHLKAYGDRTGEELKLETQTLRDRPWELITLLRGCRNKTSPELTSAREALLRGRAQEILADRLASRPWTRRMVWSVAGRVRRGIATREYLSLARARGFGILRRLTRAIGVSLAEEGALGRADDVYLITMRELGEFVRDPMLQVRLRRAVHHRRKAYRRFAEERLPHRLACRGSVHRFEWSEPAAVDAPDRDCLQGVPSSTGIARGAARVVDVPSPDIRLDGEILVAPATEPAWMFLMYAARGMVVERGSVLSHAAIIGRELGIPTVVGVEGATTRIHTGDMVEVNGITGHVRVLARGGEPGGESSHCQARLKVANTA